jgi:threonine dehydrogenase-like Zn-dependent dehydrogenase
MRGVLLPGDKRVLIEHFPEPTPGVGEVVVRVKASAICRSDLSLYYGNAVVGGDRAGKVITGHEPAGIVEAIGDGVTFVRPGDRVAIHLAIGCGHCSACRAGNFHMCPRWECLGFTTDGGNAEFLRVPERNCMRIPDAMSFSTACVSTDAFGTLYSAVTKLGVNGNTTLAIFGLGPMGSAGVLAGKALGARVIAIDPLEARRNFATDMGADEVVNTDVDVVRVIRDLTEGAGVSAAIDCSGNPVAQNAALDAARDFGKVAFIGEARETTIRPSEQFLRKQLTLVGSWYFSIAEYEEIVQCIMTRHVPLEKLITHSFDLDDAPEAFRMFDERQTEKAVFLMP